MPLSALVKSNSLPFDSPAQEQKLTGHGMHPSLAGGQKLSDKTYSIKMDAMIYDSKTELQHTSLGAEEPTNSISVLPQWSACSQGAEIPFYRI